MGMTQQCLLDAPSDAAPRKVQKRSHRATRLQLPSMRELDQRTNAAKQFAQIARNIENDLGGADRLSTIEANLIQAFAGASVALQALNVRLVRDGEQGLDLGLLGLLAGALCRLSSRLGTERRPKPVEDLYVELERKRSEASP
jgi:hypothetical protein